MGHRSRRFSVVVDAIDVVLRRLDALPSSALVDELRARANTYLGEAGGWRVSPPTVEQRERLMRQVLALHIEVAKLERARPAS